MKQNIINQMVAIFKATLNEDSKWYNQDVADFKAKAQSMDISALQLQLERLKQFANPNSQLNKIADKEIKLMDKAGMYNVSRLKPSNALD